jgi:tetratricopeptide (TPR) repeat protein
MTRVRNIAVAMCLGIALAAIGTVYSPLAQAQQPAQKTKVSKAVGEPLKKAKEAMDKGQFDVSLAEIQKAQAVEKRTPAEDYQIDEFLGYLYFKQKDYAKTAEVYARMLESPLQPPDGPQGVEERTRAVALLYNNAKDYKKFIEWSKKYLDKNPGQEDMTGQLAFAYFKLEDYKNASTVIGKLVDNIEKGGRTPKQDYIEVMLSANYNDKNEEGTTLSLKKMVRYYPKPEHWRSLVDRYRRKTSSDRVTLGFYRLMNEVGILKEKEDYVEMAQLGIDAGVPGESQQIMESGVTSGNLKATDKTEQGRFDRVLALAKKTATSDKATLGQQQKDAEKAAKGQAEVGLGQAYLSYGQFDEAIAALERGIKKGGVSDMDEANISLGIAYLRKGQKEQARTAFKAVNAESKWSDLAELWVLRSQSNA